MPPRQSATLAKLPLLIVALLSAIFGLWAANAQIVQAPLCDPVTDYQWASNSLDQNPCLVATYLGQVCDRDFELPSVIRSDQYYLGPFAGFGDPCQCSSVLYILMSACAACQGGEYSSWTVYNVNCTTVYPGIYPESIPSATRIPKWAFQDVTLEGTFNPIEAQKVGDQPESPTGASEPTGTSFSFSIDSIPTFTNSPISTPKIRTKSLGGAIAGGVVGGVLALCGAIVACWRRRRNRRRNSENTDEKPSTQTVSSETIADPLPSPGFPIPSVQASSVSVPSSNSNEGQKIYYNPTDPVAYPTTVQLLVPPSAVNHPVQSQHGPPHGSESNNPQAGYYTANFQTMIPNRPPVVPEIY